MSIADLLQEALQLPPDSRANLVEKIVESLETDIDPSLEQAHLQEIEKRMQSVSSGQSAILPGDETLSRARSILPK